MKGLPDSRKDVRTLSRFPDKSYKYESDSEEQGCKQSRRSALTRLPDRHVVATTLLLLLDVTAIRHVANVGLCPALDPRLPAQAL